MLNPFPLLLSFALLSPLLLRVALGGYLVFKAFSSLGKNREANAVVLGRGNLKAGALLSVLFGVAEGIAGLMLVAGFLTQIAALYVAILCLLLIVSNGASRLAGEENKAFYFLALIVALSLIFSGAGLLAVDIPL